MNFKNKTVTVVGLGKSGFAAAKFLASKKARVRATDHSDQSTDAARRLKKLGVQVEIGGHTPAFVKGSGLVVTSPGVPKSSLPLALARRLGIPVISEIELASFFCRGRIVAITGSNGKTTTCHLVHWFLKDGGVKSVLCGNVGYSFLDAIADIDKDTVVVLELSSFQLEDSPTFRPDVAAILNISPNHLDRHKTLRNYVRAKQRIYANQRRRDVLWLNEDDDIVRRMRPARAQALRFGKKPLREGVFFRDGMVIRRKNGRETPLLDYGRCRLKGEHNLENVMVAAAIAHDFGVAPASLQKTAAAFKTLEHRIEPLGEAGGVRFVNDSKSTTLDSTRAAIEAVAGPVVLVAGGRDKGAPFEAIEPVLEAKAELVVLYGESRGKIAASWKNFKRIKMEADFGEAVKLAFRSAKPGRTLLLSPMCTSFDQFSSYAHRGEAFKALVREFKSGRWKR